MKSINESLVNRPLAFVFTLFACMHPILLNAGGYPIPIISERDIRATKANVTDIDVWKLPLEHYQFLKKFHAVKRVRLDSLEGTFATNEKLDALSNLGLTNIMEISLLNCKLVEDDGIRALSRIQSLRMLQLEGTSITDASLELISKEMRLSGLNVANCEKITLSGIRRIVLSDTLREFSFSVEKIQESDVVELIKRFKNIAWCEIVDPQRKLNESLLKSTASQRNVHVAVRPTGSLQDMRNRNRR